MIKESKLVRKKRTTRGKGKKDRVEWALVSKTNPKKILRWFGPRKPSKKRVAKEERRVHSFASDDLVVKKLIVLANELDSRGLIKEAGIVDELILKTSAEESLDTRDRAEQGAGKQLGTQLAQRLNISSASPLFSMFMNIPEYSSWQDWISSQPESHLQGVVMKRIFNLGFGTMAAFAIPALAIWNFDNIGRPKTKLIDLYIRKNRNCLYKGLTGAIKRRGQCRARPLGLADFNEIDVNSLQAALEGAPLAGRTQALTGTPPPLIAYALILAETGGMNELAELAKGEEPVITHDVSRLVKNVGLKLRREKIDAERRMEIIRKTIYDSGIYPDTPGPVS